jgi:hypothetical protein
VVEVVRTSAGHYWPAYPTWKNGPWPNRRCSPVSDDDLVAAFGAPVKSIAEHEAVGWYEAHVVLDSDVVPPFRVFVKHHSVVDPPPGEETAEWWPKSDLAEVLEGLGDEAYTTVSGGAVCRQGVRWTAGVLPLSREHKLPPDQCWTLLWAVLTTSADQGFIKRWQRSNTTRSYSDFMAVKFAECQHRRELRREALLSGVPPAELDAWLDRWHARRRIQRAKIPLLVAPLLALLSALSNPDQWLENIGGMLLICVAISGILWLCYGLGHPRKYKEKLREQTWP